MGGGFVVDIAHWSKGDYDNASNTQDDLAIIAGRFPYRDDDHGDANGDATATSASGTQLNISGVIENTDDPDVFAITASAGPFSATATPGALVVRPNSRTWSLPALDIKLELRQSDGTLLEQFDATNALDATIATTLPSDGTYYLHVIPDEQGDPFNSNQTGYTTYGSIGSYELTVDRTLGPSAPEIAISGDAGDGRELSDGDNSPATNEGTDFGSIPINTTRTYTFTISNEGGETLNLGSNAVSLSQSGSEFTVTSQPNTTIAAGNNSSFSVRYAPTSSGSDNATVSVANDDSDESPFTFSIEGVASEPGSVVWSTTDFTESTSNDGSIDPSQIGEITLSNDTFTGNNGQNYISAGKIIASGVPSGLSVAVTRRSATRLEISWSGQADNHTAVDSTQHHPATARYRGRQRRRQPRQRF